MHAQGEYLLVVKPPAEEKRSSGLLVPNHDDVTDAPVGIVQSVGPFVPSEANIALGDKVYCDHFHRVNGDTYVVAYGAIFASESHDA